MKRNILKIVIFATCSLATAMFASRPAGAFEVTASYKYLLGVYKSDDGGVDTNSAGHGAQIDFMWSLIPGNKGRTVPGHSLGFSMATGKVMEEVSGAKAFPRYEEKSADNEFYRFSFLYEFIFTNGLGLSVGIGGGAIGGQVDYGVMGLTDLGVKYHLKNGLVFSLTTDLMLDPATFSNVASVASVATTTSEDENDDVTFVEGSYSAFAFGLATGIGYRF